MSEVRLRMWHEWTDKHGAHHTDESSFEAWQSEMRPHRDALLAVWACRLRLLLDANPDEIPHEALHELYADAETLRTLDDNATWKEPFNQMRGAVQQRDFVKLRQLAVELDQP